MSTCKKINDLQLVQQCIERQNDAWKIFLHRFQSLILTRIGQIFFRRGFRYGTADLQDAFDAVIDHLVYGRGLNGFKRNDSLDSYVRTVATRAVIDWYRKRTSCGKLNGMEDFEVLRVIDSDLDNSGDSVTALSMSDPIGPDLSNIDIPESERLLLIVLLVRTNEVSKLDIDAISQIASRSSTETENVLRKLRNTLNARWLANQEKYELLQLVWIKMVILERKGETDKAQKRKSQYDTLLAAYRKKGIEPYPSRKDLADVFSWDINKVDRIYRKLEETLERKTQFKKSRIGKMA